MVSWFNKSRHIRWFDFDISVRQRMVKNNECNGSNLWQPVTSVKVANSSNWMSPKFFLTLSHSETLNLHAVSAGEISSLIAYKTYKINPRNTIQILTKSWNLKIWSIKIRKISTYNNRLSLRRASRGLPI